MFFGFQLQGPRAREIPIYPAHNTATAPLSSSVMATNGHSASPPRFATLAVHAGSPHDPTTGAVIESVRLLRPREEALEAKQFLRYRCQRPTLRNPLANPSVHTNTQEAAIPTGTEAFSVCRISSRLTNSTTGKTLRPQSQLWNTLNMPLRLRQGLRRPRPSCNRLRLVPTSSPFQTSTEVRTATSPKSLRHMACK